MSPSQQSIARAVEERSRRFKARFLQTTSAGLVIAAIVAIVLTLLTDRNLAVLVAAGVAFVVCGTSLYLSREGRPVAAAYVLTYGISGVGVYSSLSGAAGPEMALVAMLFMILVLGFLATPKAALLLGAINAALLGVVEVDAAHRFDFTVAKATINVVVVITLVLAYCVVTWMFLRHVAEAFGTLRDRLEDIDAVVVRARSIADGDLSGDVEGESDVSAVLRSMTTGLRDLVERIQSSATQLGAAASEIGAMTTQQSQSTVEQSSAVEETRESLRSMLTSSTQIAASASEVLGNAERTVSTSELVATRVSTLAAHTERVTEILETVREIANKAELLALNAALEGTKAGEAGRGFSLVAARMQGLAEGVIEAVKSIRALTNDIREATNATVLSLEEANKLANATTEKARQIALVCQQQRSSTEQVTEAMEDISRAVASIAAGSDQTATATRDLSNLAGDLTLAVNRFSL